MIKPLLLASAITGLAAMASAQTYTTIAEETFDYAPGTLDGSNGGTGWINAWTGTNATLSSPGFDAVGGLASTTVEHGGNWRTIDAGVFPGATMLDQNNTPAFGVDGTTVWVTFSQQRVGASQEYGGLSLTGQFLGEKLFIGSPGGSNEMGIDSAFCCGGTLATIPGSSADNLHEIVVKIDFQSGDEDISVWLDPVVAHPDPNVTIPDIASTATDFVFNEIRLQSGTGTGQFDFDAILIELEEAAGFIDACSGDGGNQMGCTDCPCGNNAPPGTIGGCVNSAGSSTRLIASGGPSVSLPSGSTSDLQFAASGSPPSATNVLISGNAIAPQSMANPCFGLDSGAQAIDRDGLRCAVQLTIRHGNRAANAMGDIMDTTGPNRVWGGPAQPTAGLAVQGGFVAGQTRYFQITHRDDAMAVCMRGLNTSQAVGVTFTP